jgi:3-isopropylmalate dehydratase small subunit
MEPFTRLDGRAAPLALANIDTDQIIPAQFLKTVERAGLGKGLFNALRFHPDGTPRADFVLNEPAYKGVNILIAGDNSTNNGLLLIPLPEAEVEALMDDARGGNHTFAIDLEAQTVTAPSGTVHRFEIDPGRKQKLLLGLDPIGETLQHQSDIDAYEEKRRLQQPWAAA